MIDMMKIVKGNDFSVKIPVKEVTGIDTSGNKITKDMDLSLCSIIVNLYLHGKKIPVSFSKGTSSIIVPISELPVGVYSLEIIVVKDSDNARSYKKEQFEIVYADDESDTASNDSDVTYELAQEITAETVFLLGRDNFEIWKDLYGNSQSTEEDYFNWLKKPLTDTLENIKYENGYLILE